MRVSDLMSHDVVTIGARDGCDEALARMVRFRVRHLPVLGEDGTVRGIVTDRDLRHQLFDPDVLREIGRRPVDSVLRERPIGEIMSAPAICVSAAEDVEGAAGLMRRHRIGSVPVLEAGKVVGILTETDVLRHIVRTADASSLAVDVIVSYP